MLGVSCLGVVVAMLAALLLEVCSSWVAGLVFPALVPWPRDSRGHALRLWSHLREEQETQASRLTAPGLCFHGTLGKLFLASSSVLPASNPSFLPGGLGPSTSGECSGHLRKLSGNEGSVPHQKCQVSVLWARMAPSWYGSSPEIRGLAGRGEL